jgi:hypothetical protein
MSTSPRLYPGGIVIYELAPLQKVTEVLAGRTAGKGDRGAPAYALKLACGHLAFRLQSRGPAPKRARCCVCLDSPKKSKRRG